MKVKTEDLMVACGCRSVGECMHNLGAEEKALEKLVDLFAQSMKEKLIAKYKKGFHGWDDPKDFTLEALKRTLDLHLEKVMDENNMVNLANLLAFWWNRV